MESQQQQQPSPPPSLQSMCHVRASELFPKAALECEDEACGLPFVPICGEAVEYVGRTADGVLALSNYRLYLQLKDTHYNVPLGLVEQVEVREIFFLHIACKDARSLRCTFATNELCLDWFRRLHKATSPAKAVEDIFAFAFYAWSGEDGGEDVTFRLRNLQTHKLFNFSDEVKRLRFDLHGAWRVTCANLAYRLCPSYPRQLLVPACISDDVLETVSRFRSSKRIPAVVWRHVGNGAVIARCSQPEVGWLGWRSSEDEDLLKAIADACAYDRGGSTMMDAGGSTDIDAIANGADDSESNVSQGKKVLIMDARSYTTAVANRARGGGVECPEYYPSCDIQFMNLANIHSIRKSFHAVRQLCSTAADQPNWFSLLENTRWLQHMSGLLRAAVTVVTAIEEEGRPVLVHCSDGWDRTSQIVSLAQLLLDPYYRTSAGFQVLVEREWLDFGHKFADRCGHAVGAPDDLNERCPVFLQWLDCVHQLLLQFPCAFEFNQPYLVKLAQHTYSNLFGTFLANSLQERQNLRIAERTFSAWNFLAAPTFRNHLFCAPGLGGGKGRSVLWPSCKVRDLVVWCEVFLGAGEATTPPPTPAPAALAAAPPLGSGKTRSYDDLVAAQEHYDMQRRSSDPNLTLDCLHIAADDGVGGDIIEENMEDAAADLVQDTFTDNIKGNIIDAVKSKTHEDFIDTLKDIIKDNVKDAVEDDVKENVAVSVVEEGLGGKLDRTVEDKVSTNLDLFLRSTDSETDISAFIPCRTYREAVLHLPAESDRKPEESDQIREESKRDPEESDRIPDESNGKLVDDGIPEESDNEESETTTTTESRSENTLCAANNAVNEVRSLAAQSVESSTDTLVADPVNVAAALKGAADSAGAKDGGGLVNALMRPPPGVSGLPVNGGWVAGEECRVCASSRKFLAEKERERERERERDGSGSSSTSGKTSRYSTPPLYSRTPSSGYPTPNEEREPPCRNQHCRPPPVSRFDEVDGLAPVQNDVQARVHQLITEHRIKEEALQRDLHSTRLALIQQVCHRCSDAHDRQDDAGSVAESVHSLCSNEPYSVAGESSLVSDVSWEAIDGGDGGPTLWVPDHAVSHCMGCSNTFWIGRRKHHCRNCGKIFCSDCSENTVPLPDEQLYNPVRVCLSCYTLLHPNPQTFASNQPAAANPVLDNHASLASANRNGYANGQTANGSANHGLNGYGGGGGVQVTNGNSREDPATDGSYLNGFGGRTVENGYSNGYPKSCSNGIDQSCQQGAQCGANAEGSSCAKSVVAAVST